MMNKNGTSIKLKRTKKKEAKKRFACWHVVLLHLLCVYGIQTMASIKPLILQLASEC